MSTISSMRRLIEQPCSENTRTGWVPSRLIRVCMSKLRSGNNASRYFTMYCPSAISIFRQSISSIRLTSDSGTAFGRSDAARKIKSETVSCRAFGSRSAVSVDASLSERAARPSDCASTLGSTTIMTEPSPRMVMPDRDVPQLRRHRLDDDPLGVKDIVDNSSENLTARLNDNDEPIRGIASPQLKLFFDVDKRQ